MIELDRIDSVERVQIFFASAASKAQDIEALLQEMLIAAEVANDRKNRSFKDIAAEVEKLPLGVLKARYLGMVKAHLNDPLFTQMWEEINEERIFRMHKFFNVFPLTSDVDRLTEAAKRLTEIDGRLDLAQRFLRDVRDRGYAHFGIPPARFRDFLKFVTEQREKGIAS
jgi:hypothetical protein